MECGISTACFYPMETTQSLEALLQAGHKVFEIFFNTDSELEPTYLARMKELLDFYGGRVKSVHPFTCGYEGVLLFSNYETRFHDSLRYYGKYCRAAQTLGAQLLILHGMFSKFRNEETETRYFDRYTELYKMGQSYGVTVAQENVTQYFGEDPAFIRRMRTATNGECGFCFDVKQAVRSDVDCYEMLSAMGDKLRHVHLNDNRPEKSCLLPGQGTMDLAKLLRTLQNSGYDEDIIIEVYRGDFQTVEELNRSRDLVEKWIYDAEKATKI